MAYHDEIVKVVSEFNEEEAVYRYLRKCKHCVGWRGGDAMRGPCSKLAKQTGREVTTCNDFVATDVGLNTMWVETEARIGDELCRITYKGRSYFVDRGIA